MSEVMRPKWLESDEAMLILFVFALVVFIVVPATVISLPVVGPFFALWWGKLIGEMVGERGTKHWMAILGTTVSYILLPFVLQLFYGWKYGNWVFFLPSAIIGSGCYWFGFKLGQHDEYVGIREAQRILRLM